RDWSSDVCSSDLAQHLLRGNDEEPAVGQVQGARLDVGEVGDQGALVHFPLDAAHQVVVGGVLLDDHRRAVVGVVVHQYVDLVLAQGQLPGGRTPVVAVLGHLDKELQILGDV